MRIYLERVGQWLSTTVLGACWLTAVLLVIVVFLIGQVPVDPLSKTALAFYYTTAMAGAAVASSIAGTILAVAIASLRFIKRTLRRQLIFIGLTLLVCAIIFFCTR